MNKKCFLNVVFLCISLTSSSYSASVPISIFAKIGWAFGSGAASGGTAGSFFGPATFVGGLAIGGGVGVIKLLKDKKDGSGAQAPGIPTEKDGFVPSKNWDGKKRRHPINGKVGWPDKKGNIWVSTGPGPLAHGGPHWDVQTPDGMAKNVYPGGRVR